MSHIQLILIVGGGICVALYFVFFRTLLRDRLVVVGLFLAGMLAVLFPQRTTDIAVFLGVGRGTDLVLYLFVIGTVFVGLVFYSKLARLERTQTELIRALAVNAATRPPPHINSR